MFLKKRSVNKSSRKRESIYLAVWGLALVVGSFAFLYLGFRIDQTYRTEPFFMIGLFLLAVAVCIGRFYQIVWRKWAEQQLHESEQRLFSILQGSPIATFVLGKDHRVIYWNRAVEVLSKIKAEDVVGTTDHWRAFYNTQRPCMADLLVDEDPDAIPEWYSGACTKSKLIAEAYEGMDFFPVLGEKGKWLRFTAAVIRNSEGRLIGAVETLEDITEQKQAEAELIKIKKLESLGLLADGIAHDFGGLLSAILRNIFLAKISVPDEDNILEQDLEIAEKASLQAKELTNRLITFSKGGNPFRKPTPLVPLLRETAQTTLHQTNITCRFDLPDDLWTVDIDDGQIRQVVLNLLNNAREAMPEGGDIIIRAENIGIVPDDKLPLKDGKYVKWSVIDHGIGIPKENLEKLFEPYFTTKQKSGSTGIGLGLAMSYAIVKKHEGFINIKSEPRRGTTVDIYLPASRKTDTFASSDVGPLAPGRKRFLVMDHDAVMRDAAEIMLHFLGCDCDFAHNREEALRAFRAAMAANRPYTAVILDSSAPDDAVSILHALQQMSPEVRAIVACGDEHPLLVNFRKTGFSGAITRPYIMDDLREILNPKE